MKTIRIGTSGFSYDDWIGTFYPPSLKPNHRWNIIPESFAPSNSTFLLPTAGAPRRLWDAQEGTG